MTRVAIDLLGGDGAPEVVADAVALLVAEGSGIDLVLVGPPEVAARLLAERGIDHRVVSVLPAQAVVTMAQHPLPALRDDLSAESPTYTATVAARAVRNGLADAWVSVGHTGAAVMAASLGLGRIPGMQRAALAVVLPGLEGPVVLLDAGASFDVTPELLAQFALAGWAYARSLGIVDPAVGLLNIGAEDGKGDALRKQAHTLMAQALAEHGIAFAGNVEGHDVVRGAAAQVVVTDGFTGNVLLKSVEGALVWARSRFGAAYGDHAPADDVVRTVSTGDFAGGMLLGVQGVSVVGHGAGTAPEIAACIRLAARAVERGTVAMTVAALSELAGA